MIAGILKEPQQESRVSLLPEGVSQLTKKGHTVLVESGAGLKASASDGDYEKAGATITSAEEVVRSADVILCIHQPSSSIPSGKVLLGMYQPLFHQDQMK